MNSKEETLMITFVDSVDSSGIHFLKKEIRKENYKSYNVSSLPWRKQVMSQITIKTTKP